jgi:hypothetical protein
MKSVEGNKLPGSQVTEEKSERAEVGATSSQAKSEQPESVPAQTKSPLKDNNRLLVLGGGTLVLVFLLSFAIMGVVRNAAAIKKNIVAKDSKKTTEKTANGAAPDTGATSVPILEAGRATPADTDTGRATAENVGQTARRKSVPPAPANLGGVKPFDNSQTWQPAAYQPGLQPSEATGENAAPIHETTETRSEREAMDKPSLVFVKSNTSSAAHTAADAAPAIDAGVGLPPGTRLRARLESAISTAVRTPVVAVIEYNYEQDGEIVIPAGAKAFGHLEAADRSGYIGIRFDSLTMPDGSSVNLEAAATDLQLRPLKGKVEGRNTGKNILLRSFAGVGEIAATLVGRGSINQPLSAGDLLRERLSNNIGQASDQTVANLAITERIVISVPASTEIYVVLQKAARENSATSEARTADKPGSGVAGAPSIQELRQLLQLQRELNQSAGSASSQ